MTADTGGIIERLRAATGTDRRLDADIGKALGWQVWSFDDNAHIQAQIAGGMFTGKPSEHPDFIRGGGRVEWRYRIEGKPAVYGELPSFTASLDAALSLVPGGHVWTVATWWCDGTDRPPFYADCASGSIKDGEDVHVHEGRGATPAIALCIAALLARQAREGAGDAVAAEREACAAICEQRGAQYNEDDNDQVPLMGECYALADTIRARAGA